MNPLRSVGARLSLALVLVVALALALVYAVVVPQLRNRLINTKLDQMRRAMPQIAAQIPTTQFDWADKLEIWSSRANARVVVYTTLTPPAVGREASLTVDQDSHNFTSQDVTGDSVAQSAVNSGREVAGTIRRGENEFAEVARPVALGTTTSGGVVLLSAPLQDALGNVDTVQRRLVEAGALALLVALVVGYGLASVFARRIRRLEAAAEQIADGRFDEPVVDKHDDELGQLARAFERMRLRLSQLERARREFVGNASHELRTPLFSLRGFIELLMDEDLDEPTRAEFLETMREQVDRLQRLAEDLLDLTRLDAGRMHLEHGIVDLAELAQDLGEEFRGIALATDHPLDVEAGDARALGDEQRIVRIGRALVENAVKHTPPGTPIRIRAVGSSLIVEDEGPGIPDEHSAQIFERFYRVDGARASGSGLGLAIARELASAMDGTLTLVSGSGRTTFTLRLPTAAPSPARFSRENAEAMAHSRSDM